MKSYTICDLRNGMIKHEKKVTWFEFSISDFLPENWNINLYDWSLKNAMRNYLIPTSVTSREKKITPLPFAVVSGNKIRKEQSWLFDYYNKLFKDCAQTCFEEEVLTAKNDKYAINLNVKGRGMRYEAHVDSNPIEVLLYVTTHEKGTGGELVVTPNSSALGLKEINKTCEVIYPKSGKLLVFDFRKFPHYVRPITEYNKFRVAVAMNYYTKYCTEEMRPADLDSHLYGVGVRKPFLDNK